MRELHVTDTAFEKFNSFKEDDETNIAAFRRLLELAGVESLDSVDEETAAEIEEMAENTLLAEDLHAMAEFDRSAIEHLRITYDIDPADYQDESELLHDVRAARNEHV